MSCFEPYYSRPGRVKARERFDFTGILTVLDLDLQDKGKVRFTDLDLVV